MNALERLSQAANEWNISLDAAALGRIETYLKAVKEKNAITNLTADDSWDDLVLKHAADGVFAASVLKKLLGAKPRILDLGSGGGFIGICLKIAWPEAEISLMEAVERKYKFLNSAVTALKMPGLRPLWKRAGDGKPRTSYDSDFDCVIERALAPLPEAVALATPLLKRGGHFAAFQSEEIDPQEPALARALAAAGVKVLQSHAYRRPGEERDRRLAIFARGED